MKRALLLLSVAMIAAVPVGVSTQDPRYPVTVIAPGKGPYSFPDGYQTPWDRIEIRVTEKMSPNLFVLHGSQGLDPAHPDASGGRAMVLFGPDGILMVDTQNRQVAEKTLKAIRSFTSAPIRVLVNTHIHSDHTGANAFFAGQGALIYSQENLRDEMLRPPLRVQRAARSGARHGRHSRRHISVQPRHRGRACRHLHDERRNSGFHPDDAVAHGGRHHRALPERERDLHRGFLSELRLSVCRSGQRRINQRHARSGRPHRENRRTRHDARSRPWHARQEEGSPGAIAPCSSTSWRR